MFEQLELDTTLCRALAEMGFSKPTSIQSKAIPAAMDGKDVLASAPTGTGKTAAFLLPVCQFLLDFPRRDPGACRALILTPTRELALQVYEHAKAISQFTRLECGVITGGINYGTDRDTLSKNLDILVATPGRLLEHIETESFDCREIESLVLDEADRMLDMGFSAVVNRIAAEARWRKQSMLFSATLEGTGVEQFAREILNDPVLVEATPSRRETGKILEWVHLADDPDHKYALLKHLLSHQIDRAVVFVKTRERLMQLRQRLENDGVQSCYLQGEMPQDKRNAALASFKQGDVNVLLATDVAARGLDVEDISHVINFDLPRTADVYVHRIGRTARAGKKGIAISLVEAHEMGILAKIERYTEHKLKRRVVDGLKPKHKEARVPKKKKKTKTGKTKNAKSGAKKTRKKS